MKITTFLFPAIYLLDFIKAGFQELRTDILPDTALLQVSFRLKKSYDLITSYYEIVCISIFFSQFIVSI